MAAPNLQLQERFDSIEKHLVNLRGFLDRAGVEEELAELDREMQAPDFWDNPSKSAPLLQKRRAVERRVQSLRQLREDTDELEAWRELIAEGEGDTEAVSFVERVEGDLERLELELKLSGPDDARSALIAIHPGAGGTESQDWAEMLERMYLRYADQRGFDVEMLDHQDGDEAGIKSSTFAVRGENAFGYLKSENGVHRLVRISPYDAAARRHTSFASVYVYPEVDDDIEVDLQDKDIKVDTYRASGAGGQHVNKTDSAVRMTHMPTGIVVTCQNERSQHKNRASAMKILRARLYDLEMKKRDEERAATEDAKMDIAWGSQIRSYVLHPYRMVKDHRTSFEVGDADSVLDGDVQPFIEAYLRESIDGEAAS
ncbi:MAG: peptide chain release factor 2 [Acidobacteriota bacterium]